MYKYDRWLVNRFIQFIPDTKGLLSRMDRPAQKYIRVNTLKITRDELKERLVAKGFVLKDTILMDVFAVQKSPYPLGASIEYLLGYYYIQDLSSCVAVETLDVKEEHVILDMTSAPGGKTTLIAQKMKNRGSIIALESNLNRINSILFNTFRCGVFNTLIYRMDARQVARLDVRFDRVLLDAPCSCEGIIAKHAARKTSRQPKDIEYCSSRQKILIEAGIKAVRPGGILVYCTCSFAPEENESIISYVLDKFPVKVEPAGYGTEGLQNFGDFQFRQEIKNTRRLYPHIHDTLGFYIARLRIMD